LIFINSSVFQGRVYISFFIFGLNGILLGILLLYLLHLMKFKILLQLYENLRVLLLSFLNSILGEIVPINVVLQFPPKESFKIFVNYESL